MSSPSQSKVRPWAIARAALRRRLTKGPAVVALLLIGAIAIAACTGSVAVNNGWSAPHVDNGFIYIGSQDGKVLALKATRVPENQPLLLDRLDLSTAADKGEWQFPPPDKPAIGAIYGTPAVTETRVFIGAVERGGSLRHALFAFDRVKGTPTWTYPTEGDMFGSPVFFNGLVIFADDEGYVYALRADDGAVAWKVQVSDKRFWSTPAVVDGVVYIGGMDKRLYALDAASGRQAWRFDAEGAIAATPLVVGDLIYVGDFDRKFYAIDRATGKVRARFETDNWIWNDAVFKDGTVFVGSLGGTFYALDAQTLQEKWRFPKVGSNEPTGPIRSQSVILGDRVLVATKAGNVTALNVADGSADRRLSFTVGEEVLASLVVANGSVYIHDQESRLLARQVNPS